MIRRSDIFPAGHFGKPHGIRGELTAVIDDNIDPTATDCLVVEIDGIYVPFFINSIRPKGTDTWLISLDGIGDEKQAKELVNRQIYMREAHRRDVTIEDDRCSDDDGMYAADLIGFTILTDDGQTLGRITDIDDTTQNVLFIVDRSDDNSQMLIPVADEFITDIDTDHSTITMNLPEGL